MRLLIITSQITNSGGVSSILVSKANALIANHNFDVAIASTNDSTSDLFFNLDARVQLFFMKTRMNNVFNLLHLKKEFQFILDTYKPDVISVADNGLKSFFIKKIVGSTLPVIYEIHGNASSFYNGDVKGVKSKLHKIILKKFLPKFDVIVVQNKLFELPISHQNVVYIPNFINSVIEKQNLISNKLIAVGRVVSTKNYERLIKVWKEIHLRFPDKQLHIYGSWEDDIIVKIIQASPNVYLHKPVSDLKKIYADAYMLLHTSYIESFPMVFLEAMSFGLPIVCFDINQPNIVLNKNTGYVINLNDYHNFSKSAIHLIENVNLAKKFSLNALKHIQNFSEESVVKQWAELYKNRAN